MIGMLPEIVSNLGSCILVSELKILIGNPCAGSSFEIVHTKTSEGQWKRFPWHD